MQVSLENGIVLNFDIRTLPSDLNLPSPSRFMLAAHDGAASSLDVNPHIRGCILTGGTDKMVKLWNITDRVGGQKGKKEVSLVTSRDVGVVSIAVFDDHHAILTLWYRVKFFRQHFHLMIPSLWRPLARRGNCRFGTLARMQECAKLSHPNSPRRVGS